VRENPPCGNMIHFTPGVGVIMVRVVMETVENAAYPEADAKPAVLNDMKETLFNHS
jgi:hypothetical protein